MTATPATLVRPAEADDARAMGEVHVAAWQVGYQGLLPDELLDGLTIERSAGAWTTHFAGGMSPASTALVAEVDGRVAGISSFGTYRSIDGEPPALDLCELWMINVHPDFWGAGVAEPLLTAAVDGLRSERPEPRAALWVLDGNARAMRFYQKHGWSPDGGLKQDRIGDTDVTEHRYVRLL